MAGDRQDEWLAVDRKTFVSPSWLVNGRSRYAIRTITRLESSPRRRALSERLVSLGFLLFGLVMLVVSLRLLINGATPVLVPQLMLAGSLVLCLFGGMNLWLPRPSHWLRVHLSDGTVVTLTRRKAAAIDHLLAGLHRAMDWHHAADLQQAPAGARHLQRGVAHGRRARPVGSQSGRQSVRRSRRFVQALTGTGRKTGVGIVAGCGQLARSFCRLVARDARDDSGCSSGAGDCPAPASSTLHRPMTGEQAGPVSVVQRGAWRSRLPASLKRLAQRSAR